MTVHTVIKHLAIVGFDVCLRFSYPYYMDYAHCGVGLLANITQTPSHQVLKNALTALKNVEHRGGTDRSGKRGDGAGVMTAIPWELFKKEEGKYAVASLLTPKDPERHKRSLEVFENVFQSFELEIEKYREIPINEQAIDLNARKNRPNMVQVFIKRPEHCRTMASFDELLYLAKQMVRSKQKDAGIRGEFFFTSLSSRTIIYKAMATSKQLVEFYPDLQNPEYKTNFALFHRRFSTNTLPSWDKVQPFRLIAHNGEINTIEGNKSVAFSRERAIGLRRDQVLTHEGTSDSGNLNGMVEALKYRSSIPHLSEVLAIMIPPASSSASNYYQFWSRAMEPWDGPALVAFSDGKRIGARLDRNGFRPCRWLQTKDTFYLCSEAGSFEIPQDEVVQSGVLYAGRCVTIHLLNSNISFKNPDQSEFYKDAYFDSRLKKLDYCSPSEEDDNDFIENKMAQFYYTKEGLTKELYPMIDNGKEAIGSMGDTATMAVLSKIPRSLYDYFHQGFAQVTNPPLDYLRERLVTDLSINLGRQPNIFGPKELIPPPAGIRLPGPVLSLGQLEAIKTMGRDNSEGSIKVDQLNICFERKGAEKSFLDEIDRLTKKATELVKNGTRILILSDRESCYQTPAIPSILVLRAIQLELNKQGTRLRASIVIDSGEISNSHHVASLISFGASAVCPYLSLKIARNREAKSLESYGPDKKEQQLIQALEDGLLKVMAKRGISVVRSYQGSELFTIIGLDPEIQERFFPRHKLTFGGLKIKDMVNSILERTQKANQEGLPNDFLYKEHAGGSKGEKHSLTSKRSRLIHKIIQKELNDSEALDQWKEFNDELNENPINIRDLLDYKKNPVAIDQVTSVKEILTRFGSGAMSFGSISAESQRDLILAFREINGRSNSGEGGENPFYFTEGITAKVKQIASGRFGVTAEYLTIGSEVQIKIAQGAKPGEGGQLMGIKVNEEIARARFSNPGVDLISPPPQHDIYSIEDLAQLIYELKQLRPGLKVSVKLVSNKNIGAIATGVVKAGADAIQISGGSGGTGAANLLSMKHTGLPWEIGLLEVHRKLTETGLRKYVTLRTDGGLLTGLDVIKAALLGAEEYDFGKMLLVSQGCIMARICEKNTCPTGIATQDPKFKKRYKGKVEETVKMLHYIGQDVRFHLSQLGFKDLKDIIGRNDLLEPNSKYDQFFKQSNLNLEYFLTDTKNESHGLVYQEFRINHINNKIIEAYRNAGTEYQGQFEIKSTDRAIATTLAGEMALDKKNKKAKLEFIGSAGQGFAAFMVNNMEITLRGEANDGVAKSMSGGKITITTHPDFQGRPELNVLVGNACLYGATGGQFFLNGLAGDRFCVRNSGATAVTLGAGLHACEYMTRGKVFILGPVLENLGAGMTGGEIFTIASNKKFINDQYLQECSMDQKDKIELRNILNSFIHETASEKVKDILNNIEAMIKLVPRQ